MGSFLDAALCERVVQYDEECFGQAIMFDETTNECSAARR